MTPFQKRQIELMRQMERSFGQGSSQSQLVSMQSDYANDDQLCLTTVSFAPLGLADTIYTHIIKPLAEIDPEQYYFPKSSLHVTIHNVRVVNKPKTYTKTDIELAKTLLRQSIPTYLAPTFTLEGLLSMPTSLAIIALVDPNYDCMVKSIRKQFIEANLPDDKKYFTNELVFANMTICRYTHTPSEKFLAFVAQNRHIFLGKFVPKEVSLIESNAGIHPTKTTIFETYNFL